MHTLPTSTYLRRNLAVNHRVTRPVKQRPVITHSERVMGELKALGMGWMGLHMLEAKYLPQIIHRNEHIGGVVYGWHPTEGYAMLIATDRRVIFLDKKPLFVTEDELTYYVVSGVSFSNAGMMSTVTLHTRVKDYPLRTLNKRCAQNFVEYIERYCLDRNLEDEQRRSQLL